MNSLLKFLQQKILQSFWFIPAVFSLLALFATSILNWLDSYLGLDSVPALSWALTSSPEGARSLLSTIAGSAITVLGVILSTMVVVLTLASQQYGPRLVRNFIEDRPSQVVTGCFAGCFIYSVVTLKSISASGSDNQLQLSVFCAVLFALACIGLLIYFVHHVSSEIQVQSIIRRVYQDLSQSIDGLFPEGLGQEPEDEAEPDADLNEVSATIQSDRAGYIQSIDEEELLRLAVSEDLVLKLAVLPGDFVLEDAALIEVVNGKQPGEEIQRQLYRCLLIGTFPTAAQDVRYPIRLLEEIAVRALSPGINDPHTAAECLDYLTSSIRQLAGRKWPSVQRMDDDGQLRIVAKAFQFDSLLRQAYQQIHHYGRNDVTIVCKLLGGLREVAECLGQQPRRKAEVLDFARELHRKSQETMVSDDDRKKVSPVMEALESA